MRESASFETRAIAERLGWEHGDVMPPIHLSSTFRLDEIGPDIPMEDRTPEDGKFIYSRLSNPTRHAVEETIADLENGEMGFAFGSGTAAIATGMLSVVEPGDQIVAFDDLYAGTKRMLDQLFTGRLNVAVEYVDATDTDAVAAAVGSGTTLIWMETPTNPLIRLCDVAAIADIADDHDAVLGVDNTFASPYFQQPLELGADMVAHSTTKYLNGHSDGVGGALVTDDPAVAETIEFHQQTGLGNMLAPFDSYLLARGMKTLPVRMRQHEDNAMELTAYLKDHDAVDAVYYPGLESHPQHDLASEQMDGYGGVFSFELVGGMDQAIQFMESLETMNLAVSLGGVETLVNHAATMTHEPLGTEERAAIGISDSLIRVSVGLEDVEDLKRDFEQAFEAVESAVPTQ